MTLRDLTPDELRILQERCDLDYDNWKNSHGLKERSEHEVWRWAFSRGTSAGLEHKKETE